MVDNRTVSESFLNACWLSDVDLGDRSGRVSFAHSASILAPCAQKAIFKVRRHAAKMLQGIMTTSGLNEDEAAILTEAFQRLSKEDAIRVAKYLAEEAPIVVHFKPEKILAKLLQDGVYRNLFETGTSNGNPNMFARAMWEWVVFHGAYHDTAPQDRPKYGVLNTMKDPRGVFSCTGIYGKAYLVLKNTPEIRSRVTFSDRDTSNKGNVCVDCDWKHVMLLMLNMDTIDLDQVVEVAWGRKEHGSSFFNFYYKKLCLDPYIGYNEVQIHGPL
jgi:hypothetical protein